MQSSFHSKLRKRPRCTPAPFGSIRTRFCKACRASRRLVLALAAAGVAVAAAVSAEAVAATEVVVVLAAVAAASAEAEADLEAAAAALVEEVALAGKGVLPTSA